MDLLLGEHWGPTAFAYRYILATGKQAKEVLWIIIDDIHSKTLDTMKG